MGHWSRSERDLLSQAGAPRLDFGKGKATPMVDSQAFVWSESLGAYTAAANFGIMRDVEASWARRAVVVEPNSPRRRA
jgi:hypothetical protein